MLPRACLTRESENDNTGKMAPTVTLTVAPIKRQMQINLMTDIQVLCLTPSINIWWLLLMRLRKAAPI